jgi:hypothetical protein
VARLLVLLSGKGFAVPEFQQFEEFLQIRETFASVDLP